MNAAVRWMWTETSRLIAGIVLSLLVGLGFGQFITWWAARETLSTYIAFIPGNMETAGIPRKEIRVEATRGVVVSLKHLLQTYDRLCEDHPVDAVARNIDCGRVHKMSQEPVPES